MDSSNGDPEDWRDPTSCDSVFKLRPAKVLSRIGRDVYGDDYPDEAEPFSFVTKMDLARMVHLLAIGSGSVLVDLGCGRGGPGLWLARETGADLIGIDLSPNAIVQASQRINEFGLTGRVRFLVGDVCETGLPDRSCDGAVSIDVMMFVQDKAAAMREAVRILRPGASFVFTAFEDKGADLYRLALQENRFQVEVYEEKPDWRRRQLALYEKIIAEDAAIIEELGDGGRLVVAEARDVLADGLANTRHMFIAGRKM